MVVTYQEHASVWLLMGPPFCAWSHKANENVFPDLCEVWTTSERDEKHGFVFGANDFKDESMWSDITLLSFDSNRGFLFVNHESEWGCFALRVRKVDCEFVSACHVLNVNGYIDVALVRGGFSYCHQDILRSVVVPPIAV